MKRDDQLIIDGTKLRLKPDQGIRA